MKKIIFIIISILLISLGVFLFFNKNILVKTNEIDIFGEKYEIPKKYKYINTTEKNDDGTEDKYVLIYSRGKNSVDITIRKVDITNMLNEENGMIIEESLYNQGYHYDQIDDNWNEKFKNITILKFFYREGENSEYLNTLLSYIQIYENDYYEIIVRNYNNKFDYETMKEITDILSKK